MGNTTILDRALRLEQEGDYAEALTLFEECTNDPAFDEGDLLFHCAWCLENEGNTARAISLYERAADVTRIAECKLNCYFRAGWLLMHEKEPAKAADFFRYAIDYGDFVDLKNDAYLHGMYWYAHCLELAGRYIEALKWYRAVQALDPHLEPESRLRQIVCLVHICLYEEAMNVCHTFDAPRPEGFDPQRYAALCEHVDKEKRMLEQTLALNASFQKVPRYALC